MGAGLAGSCAALCLARQGVDVVLLEQDERPFNRASLRNEGKIHLGFVYANDRSLATAKRMLQGALTFGPIMQRLTDGSFSSVDQSTPFTYLVAHDSLIADHELEPVYEAISREYAALIKPGLDYLGHRPRRLFRRLGETEWRGHFSPDNVAAAFQTSELAIDCDSLARVVRASITSSDAIDLRTSHRVRLVEAKHGGYVVSGTNREGSFSLEADQVVNATWERRAGLDEQVGLVAGESLLHRLKYRVIASLPPELRGGPSATIVLGGYGDVVIRPKGDAFLSWYPSTLRGWTHAVEPPREWDPACRGEPDIQTAATIRDETLAALDAWYPGIGKSLPEVVDAGAIVARGMTDVDDVDSELHVRADIGVVSKDGFHSVDPGKLTTAPMFGLVAAQRVLSGAGSVSPSNVADFATVESVSEAT